MTSLDNIVILIKDLILYVGCPLLDGLVSLDLLPQGTNGLLLLLAISLLTRRSRTGTQSCQWGTPSR